jgi:hypothetical protein
MGGYKCNTVLQVNHPEGLVLKARPEGWLTTSFVKQSCGHA